MILAMRTPKPRWSRCHRPPTSSTIERHSQILRRLINPMLWGLRCRYGFSSEGAFTVTPGVPTEELVNLATNSFALTGLI